MAITIQGRIARIRKLAKEVGYAVAVHGSLKRDVDLVAVPWIEEAIGNHDFVEYLCLHLPAVVTDITRKPHGRYGCILQGFGRKHFDVSVMPRLKSRVFTDDDPNPYDLSDRRHPANRMRKL